MSAYLVVLGAALFSVGWAVTFYRFYSHIDDPRRPEQPKERKLAA